MWIGHFVELKHSDVEHAIDQPRSYHTTYRVQAPLADQKICKDRCDQISCQ